jgi:cytoskeleton protein RodZ
MSEPEINNIPVPENERAQDQVSIASAGARLAACRKEHGWTVEQVASQLNLAPRQIVALEHDDYPALPGMPIVRGFIRSYAKLLKIDSAPLLELVGGETVLAQEPLEPRKSLAAPFSETRLPSMADRPGLSSKWVVGSLLVILLGVGIWAAQQSPEVTSFQKSASDQVKDGIAYLSGSEANKPADGKAVVPVQQEAQQASAPAVPAVVEVPKEEPVKPAAEVTPPEEPAKPAADSGKAAASAASAVPKAADGPAKTNNGKDVLVFNAREDSWIEVRRAGDKSVLLSRTVKAGTSESVEVAEPVSVVVGNASGVEASLRGEPVELKSGGGNVARLSLK